MTQNTQRLGKRWLQGLLVLAACVSWALPDAAADLTICVDTANQQYWVEGSGEFTPVFFMETFTNDVHWKIENGGTTGGETTSDAFNFVEMTEWSRSWDAVGERLVSHTTGYAALSYEMAWGSSDTVTITGLGSTAAASYSGWASVAITQFEAWADADTVVPITLGSGATTTISAVPEPATLGLLSLGGAALLRRRKRRR